MPPGAPERDQELHQQRHRVGFSVGLGREHELTRRSVQRRLVDGAANAVTNSVSARRAAELGPRALSARARCIAARWLGERSHRPCTPSSRRSRFEVALGATGFGERDRPFASTAITTRV